MINKLLCIDDDMTTLMLIKMVTEKTAFTKEVITALSGKEALDYYKTLLDKPEEDTLDYPSLVFLDVNMPVMSGWEYLDEFVAELYPRFPDTKVVILSSSTNPFDKEKAKQYPIIIGYISKPITTDLLRKLVKK
ncbi:response regulator [Emticicia sp. TH156]|uniref:response regulator n=1 Tax=Emticicia sp. TH156 TaxID=2067454 RepID=UPI000C782656|nr:response regulator [Emticicia sp. TH156]PLK45206.1 response regulator [Emticicia sp. TH156]